MIHEVVTAPNQTLVKKITNDEHKNRNNGTITINGDERNGMNNEMVEMELEAKFNNSDGYNFFIISRTTD
jgi:hypothetical protein